MAESTRMESPAGLSDVQAVHLIGVGRQPASVGVRACADTQSGVRVEGFCAWGWSKIYIDECWVESRRHRPANNVVETIARVQIGKFTRLYHGVLILHASTRSRDRSHNFPGPAKRMVLSFLRPWTCYGY
jgi:hypothetical protein